MSIDDAISMEPVKEKLRNLREYMPNHKDITYVFGVYLAEGLIPQLSPKEFSYIAVLTLHGLSENINLNGSTGQHIGSKLMGHSLATYAQLWAQVPQIAKAVCPEDFAKSVRDVCEEINAEFP